VASVSSGENMSASCLVVGGGGFIGIHLVSQLQAAGRQVTVLERDGSSRSLLPPDVDFVLGDFGDADLIGELIDKHEQIIHLAYATVPNTSFDDPLADLTQNLPPMVQLFSEIASRKRRLVLVSSGGTVYGEAIELPICEAHPTRPISPYGVTKLTLEKYAHLYAETHGLEVVCVRPSNPYGEGQRPFVGQGFVATAMASAMDGKAITIFGDSGSTRDYIYVGDLADGIVRALDLGVADEIYNIGSGVGLSNLEIVRRMEPILKEVGCPIKIKHGPERVFDVQANVLCCCKLQKQTGWKPRVGLDEGLLRSRDWLIKYLEGVL